MQKAAQTRILAVVLAIATLGICALGAWNFVRESSFETPTDGVWWQEDGQNLQARRIPADSPGQRAGVRKNDRMLEVDGRPVHSVARLERELFRVGTWSRLHYLLNRDGKQLDVQVILEPADRTRNQGLRLIALAYLAIGLYVLFRRWTAPKATHFYVLCLTSAVLYAFKYTGQLDTLDWVFFWSNVAATVLQPALLLHFAVTFGEPHTSVERRTGVALLYLPGLLLGMLHLRAVTSWVATERLQHRLDQIDVGYLAVYSVTAAFVFWKRYRAQGQTLERQQLKWLTRGTMLAVVPYTLLYAIPYLLDAPIPDTLARIAPSTLILLPLTFAWAIVRYRLMDTDLIFKRGVTYTLATAALVGMYFLIVAVAAEVVHARLPNLKMWGLLAAIVATALIFEPIKAAIQGRVDRVFDQKRYDYRETLIEFSRGLSSQTDLPALTRAVVDRLSQTLLVERVALFLLEQVDSGPDICTLAASHGLPPAVVEKVRGVVQNVGFIRFSEARNTLDQRHLFFENPSSLPHRPEAEQEFSKLLDMHYYLPCRVADSAGRVRTLAVIGLGRTREGDFLSSVDVELLESLAGYIGIAIQNAQLFASLNRQRAEFERLKEFNENIVESIKVGIFTLDLSDRVESWNAEMEVMYALPRAEALGRPLREIFPIDFVQEFGKAHSASGTSHLLKVQLATRGGEARTVNLAIAPLLTREFVPVGRIVLVEDTTERTMLETQLTQAEKLSSIGLLAAGVAHEVNTPLAVISSYAQMLQKQTREDPRLKLVLEKITQQTFRASEIVNGLLNFSRATGSEFLPLDLNTVIRETLTLLDHQMRTARVGIHTSLAPSLPRTVGSQGKLQQVILNLLLNARDAMLEKGGGMELHVSTGAVGGNVVVTVRDTGMGIDPANLHRIYDPFFTTKNTPKEGQHKGTGLGLAVSYGIVQEHGGTIQVESEVGVGTTFRIALPALPNETHAEPAQPAYRDVTPAVGSMHA